MVLIVWRFSQICQSFPIYDISLLTITNSSINRNNALEVSECRWLSSTIFLSVNRFSLLRSSLLWDSEQWNKVNWLFNFLCASELRFDCGLSVVNQASLRRRALIDLKTPWDERSTWPVSIVGLSAGLWPSWIRLMISRLDKLDFD